MTGSQAKVLAAIKKLSERGYSPSYREIGDEVGLRSLATVTHHVRILEELGYLAKGLHHNRSVVLIPSKMDGFTGCDAGHERIYFLSASCPLCAEIQRRVAPREVSIGEK